MTEVSKIADGSTIIAPASVSICECSGLITWYRVANANLDYLCVLSRFDLPDPYRLAIRPRQDVRAIVRECYRADRAAMAFKDPYALARHDLSDPYRLIIRPQYNVCTITRECHRVNRVTMAFERPYALARLDLPDPYRLVI